MRRAAPFSSSRKTKSGRLAEIAWSTLCVMLYIRVHPASSQMEGVSLVLCWHQLGTTVKPSS
eukprot:1786942-Ditylum_brightwellii.AAC.1